MIEEGGDWDRRNRLKVYTGLHLLSIRQFKRGSNLFIDALSTFTATELLSYNDFVALTVIASALTLKRVDLKKKVRWHSLRLGDSKPCALDYQCAWSQPSASRTPCPGWSREELIWLPLWQIFCCPWCVAFMLTRTNVNIRRSNTWANIPHPFSRTFTTRTVLCARNANPCLYPTFGIISKSNTGQSCSGVRRHCRICWQVCHFIYSETPISQKEQQIANSLVLSPTGAYTVRSIRSMELLKQHGQVLRLLSTRLLWSRVTSSSIRYNGWARFCTNPCIIFYLLCLRKV